MKNLFVTLLLLGGLFFNLNLFGQGIVTDKSSVQFEVSNMAVNTVEGTFSGMKGTVTFDPNNLTGSGFDVCVDASTVDTDSEKRDEHLRNEDFFAVDKYPTICFKSFAVKAQESSFLTSGTLTMHGVSKQVEIPFTYSNNTLEGTLTIERKDFGVGEDYGSFMVGSEVEIKIVCVLK